MMNFGFMSNLDSLSYGVPAQKHLETIENQSGDATTALGKYFRRGMNIPLQPHPRNSSTKTLTDLNAVISRMAESTKAERDYAILMDNSRKHYEMWAEEVTVITGDTYDFQWFWDIGTQGEGFLNYLKVRSGRPRPYQIAPAYGKKIEYIIPDPRTASYPSGHAFDAWMFATILSERYPEYFGEFETIANSIGESRMIAGVHFPSDIEAGKMAGVWVVTNGLIEAEA